VLGYYLKKTGDQLAFARLLAAVSRVFCIFGLHAVSFPHVFTQMLLNGRGKLGKFWISKLFRVGIIASPRIADDAFS
jgi:hypothetical protein